MVSTFVGCCCDFCGVEGADEGRRGVVGATKRDCAGLGFMTAVEDMVCCVRKRSEGIELAGVCCPVLQGLVTGSGLALLLDTAHGVTTVEFCCKQVCCCLYGYWQSDCGRCVS